MGNDSKKKPKLTVIHPAESGQNVTLSKREVRVICAGLRAAAQAIQAALAILSRLER